MKTLYLLRHAKSSWDDPYLDDFDRPLSKRGRRAAKDVAQYMDDKGWRPDHVLCSSALRTRQTLERLSKDWPDAVRIEFKNGLYHAAADKILLRLQKAPNGADKVMIVGHNPGLQDFTLDIGKDHAGPDWATIRTKFPTGALAVFTSDAKRWSDVKPHSMALAAFVRPRDLE